MPATQTQPKFKLGSRVFTHYEMAWGTVVKVLSTERDRYRQSTGKPEDRMDDTTWYDVAYDKGGGNMLDDAHGNWDMARIVPPHIAKRYSYGDDPAEALREPWTIMTYGVDLRANLILSLVEALGYGNSVGPLDPASFADNIMVNMGKRSGYTDDGDYAEGYEAYAKTAGLIRHR